MRRRRLILLVVMFTAAVATSAWIGWAAWSAGMVDGTMWQALAPWAILAALSLSLLLRGRGGRGR